MAINQIGLSQITSLLQSYYNQLNALMSQVNLFFTDVVTNIGLAGLEAAPYGLSAGDAQNVMNSITDLQHLFQVYQGLMFVASGATAGSGVPTANDATHFGYPFVNNVAKTGGLGF